MQLNLNMYRSKLAIARHDGNLLEVDNSVFSSPWLTSVLGISDKEEGLLGDSSPNVSKKSVCDTSFGGPGGI